MNKKINISIVGTGLMGLQHIKAILKSKKVKPKVNGNDGLISLKIFAAIKKSAKTGKKVRI